MKTETLKVIPEPYEIVTPNKGFRFTKVYL